MSTEERRHLRRIEKAGAQLEDSVRWINEHGEHADARNLAAEILRMPEFHDLLGLTIQAGAIPDA